MDRPKHSRLARFHLFLSRAWQSLLPGRRAWTGAALALLLAALIFSIPETIAAFGGTDPLGLILGFIAIMIVGLLAAIAAWLLVSLLSVPPVFFITAAGGAIGILYLTMRAAFADIRIFLLAAFVTLSLVGAGAWVLLRGGWKQANKVQRAIILAGSILGLAGLVWGILWLLPEGFPVDPPVNAAAQSNANLPPITLSDPSQPGFYAVKTLFYGSGQDLHRTEYGPKVDLITEAVDGSVLVGGWSGLRRSYWGFGPESMPLNGRVWYPDGAGPFPLVLIVHGNHIAEYYSDPGYSYLGELFASRGFILVSVDENFINISPSADLFIFQPLNVEDDARGWLLLEHLRTWQAWNENPSNPFYRKVDMERIALIGHSRGGEGVVAAANFNRLPYYPDDASLAFHYNFSIRAIAAIAPIDGQYLPRGQPLPLENVSYFVLHGVHDMQALAFEGRRLYESLRFTDQDFHFKSAIYIYGANHSQFNTVWGRKDQIEPSMHLFNNRLVMPEEDQMQIAKVYLSAYLEATLHDETGYLPLFRDARYATDWLPDTIYLTQYADSSTSLVTTYEEDLDLSTTSLPGGSQQGYNLTVWREQGLVDRFRDSIHTSAVILGWDAQAIPSTASYVVRLPEPGPTLDNQSVLVFALGDTGLPSDPKGLGEKPSNADQKPSGEPIDLTVEVTDRGENVSRLPLSGYAYLQPLLKADILKGNAMSTITLSEVFLRSYEFPLIEFVQANPAFDPVALSEVRLVFDRTPAGVVALDDLGFR